MLTINTKELSGAVKYCDRIAGNSVLPIVACIAISAADGKVSLAANDMARYCRHTIDADGDIDSICVNSRSLKAILDGITAESVTLSFDGKKLIVKAAKRRATLDTLPYEDFPQPDFGKLKALDATPKDLLAAIDNVAYAASAKDVRHFLMGVYLGEGSAVAGDGFRLAYCEISGIGDTSIIIPKSSIKDLMVIKDADSVGVSESHFAVESEKEVFATSLVSGKYPDWPRLIPKYQSPVTITVSADEIVSAVSSAISVSRTKDDNKQLGVIITKQDGGLHIADMRESRAEAWCDCDIDGELVEVGVSGPYLIDAVSAAKKEGGKVTIQWEPNAAILVGGNHVISPIRL